MRVLLQSATGARIPPINTVPSLPKLLPKISRNPLRGSVFADKLSITPCAGYRAVKIKLHVRIHVKC